MGERHGFVAAERCLVEAEAQVFRRKKKVASPAIAGDGAARELLRRASAFANAPPDGLVDEMGDVQIEDSPLAIWARLRVASEPPTLRFVVAALADLENADEAARILEGADLDSSIEWSIGDNNTVQLFCSASLAVLDSAASFANAVSAAEASGLEVVELVQPGAGGLTPVQLRVLQGWRAIDDHLTAEVERIAAETGALDFQVWNWDPRIESAPLWLAEEHTPHGWAFFSATVDDQGRVRRRETYPEPRDAQLGYSLVITWIEPDDALRWLQRINPEVSGPRVTAGDLASISTESRALLDAALSGIACDRNRTWDPAVSGESNDGTSVL